HHDATLLAFRRDVAYLVVGFLEHSGVDVDHRRTTRTACPTDIHPVDGVFVLAGGAAMNQQTRLLKRFGAAYVVLRKNDRRNRAGYRPYVMSGLKRVERGAIQHSLS